MKHYRALDLVSYDQTNMQHQNYQQKQMNNNNNEVRGKTYTLNCNNNYATKKIKITKTFYNCLYFVIYYFFIMFNVSFSEKKN